LDRAGGVRGAGAAVRGSLSWSSASGSQGTPFSVGGTTDADSPSAWQWQTAGRGDERASAERFDGVEELRARTGHVSPFGACATHENDPICLTLGNVDSEGRRAIHALERDEVAAAIQDGDATVYS
jgi:hypothetical protein